MTTDNSIEHFSASAESMDFDFTDWVKQAKSELNIPEQLISPLDRVQLGKLHRMVWTGWARKQPDIAPGHLVPFAKQNKDHQEAQMRQAETMFVLGYQCALRSKAHEIPEASKRSVLQAFTIAESRLLIAAVMTYFSYHLRRKNLPFVKPLVDGLIRKLGTMASINLDQVEYFVPVGAETATGVKPRWKKSAPRTPKLKTGSNGKLDRFIKPRPKAGA